MNIKELLEVAKSTIVTEEQIDEIISRLEYNSNQSELVTKEFLERVYSL